MFDSNKRFQVMILSGGEKRCLLRYPTDGEWIEAARKRRFVRRQLGRNKSQTSAVGFEQAAAELFAKVRADQDGEAFDEAEAAAAVMKLELVEAVECAREGDGFRVVLRCFIGQVEHEGSTVDAYQRVVHRLRIPFQADVLAYRRAAVPDAIEERGMATQHMLLEPAGTLWDKIGRAEAGYEPDSAVPITHKDAAVSSLLLQMGALAAGQDLDPES